MLTIFRCTLKIYQNFNSNSNQRWQLQRLRVLILSNVHPPILFYCDYIHVQVLYEFIVPGIICYYLFTIKQKKKFFELFACNLYYGKRDDEMDRIREKITGFIYFYDSTRVW